MLAASTPGDFLPGQAGNGGRAVALAQMTNAYILLGGLTGSLIDYPVNLGLLGLRRRLQQNNVICFTYPWGNWQRAGDDIAAHAGLAATIVIGHSGGGSRATWLANWRNPPIDLMVLYDPSPGAQMRPVGRNVQRALCYHNTKPCMWWPGIGTLGGGMLLGPRVEVLDFAQFHLLVQFNQTLHARTLAEVEKIQNSRGETKQTVAQGRTAFSNKAAKTG